MKKLKRTAALWALALAVGFVAAGGVRAQTLYPLQADSLPQPGVPQGEWLHFDLKSKLYYPGAKTTISVYVPAEYDPAKPACLYVGLDGGGFAVTQVMDNLIYKKQMPVTIGVMVPASELDWPPGTGAIRYDRCFEYDSTNDRFDRYLFNEVMPLVEKLKTSDGRAINISLNPDDHMIAGLSSGGVCAFTAAWQHPELFHRVFTAIGTYVGMRGADMYPTLIRKTEPKPIRIFLQDGSADTWNPLFDNWFTQNKSMEESLRFAGYDVNHNWGVLGHEGSHATSLMPDVMRWMWRDYPQPIVAGTSGNSMLNQVLVPGQTWHLVATPEGAIPQSLATDPAGAIYCSDAKSGSIFKIGLGLQPSLFLTIGNHLPGAMAFDRNGTLYISQPDLRRILAVTTSGKRFVFSRGVAAAKLTVLYDGTVYAGEPGAHDDMPSTIWRIDAAGQKSIVDSGLSDVTGITVTPDHNLLFAAEGRSHWIYSYQLTTSGALQFKQRFYWLHTAESAGDDDDDDGAGTSDLIDDASGDLYAATRMGVQICDRNGRVEGILSLPDGPVTSLTIGGSAFDTLTVICGGKVYARRVDGPGVAGFAAVRPLPSFGAG